MSVQCWVRNEVPVTAPKGYAPRCSSGPSEGRQGLLNIGKAGGPRLCRGARREVGT